MANGRTPAIAILLAAAIAGGIAWGIHSENQWEAERKKQNQEEKDKSERATRSTDLFLKERELRNRILELRMKNDRTADEQYDFERLPAQADELRIQYLELKGPELTAIEREELRQLAEQAAKRIIQSPLR